MLGVGNTGLIGSAHRARSAAAPALPFSFDANSRFWDFSDAGRTIDSTGGVDTVSAVPEQCQGGTNRLVALNKSQQPLAVAGGVDCNTSTDRNFQFDVRPSIANGTNGWYFGAVVRPDVGNVYLMEIARAASTAASRMQLYITSSRLLALKANTTDSATLNFVGTGPALTLGQMYALEVLWSFDADTLTIWYDGVAQSVTPGTEVGPWSTFPATEPSNVMLLNSIAPLNLSFSGLARCAFFQNGVPSPAIRSSVSTYLVSRRAA